MEDKVVVITGGSSGLGKGLAALCVSKGSTVVICARDGEELEKAAQETGATAFIADVTQERDMQALADFTVSSFGRIDVWINNAGVWMPHAPFVEMASDAIRQLFEVNTFGVMYGSRAALGHMGQRAEGIIVNIISVSALSARPRSVGYAASKWAARGFTDSLRAEYRESEVRIIGVYPGRMQTELFNAERPEDFATYMTYESVAEEIVSNLESENPAVEQIIKRDIKTKH